jgi:hypothetical protein
LFFLQRVAEQTNAGNDSLIANYIEHFFGGALNVDITNFLPKREREAFETVWQNLLQVSRAFLHVDDSANTNVELGHIVKTST